MPLVDVLSPWPGRVAQLHVEVGADVVAGQEVVTIESMKIMSPVASEDDGRVVAPTWSSTASFRSVRRC